MYRIISLFVLLFIILAFPATAAASNHCQFVLGFKAFRDQHGHEIIGECLENEQGRVYGASQRTTKGLLLWMRGSNQVTFHPGDPPAPTPTPAPRPVPTARPLPTATPRPTIDPVMARAIQQMRRTEIGRLIANKIVQMSASVTFAELGDSVSQWDASPRRVTLDNQFRGASAQEITYQIIHPVLQLDAYLDHGGAQSWEDCMTVEHVVKVYEVNYWLEVYGKNGKTRKPISETEDWANYYVEVTFALGSEDALLNLLWVMPHFREYCRLFGEPPQEIHPELAQGYQVAMFAHPELGITTVNVLMQSAVDVAFGRTSYYGYYSASRNTIVISDSLRGNMDAIAATLIHETFHAASAAARGYTGTETAAECLQEEIDAFRVEANWWYQQYGRRGKRSPSRVERHYNNVLYAWMNDGLKEFVLLSEGYQEQCLGGSVS